MNSPSPGAAVSQRQWLPACQDGRIRHLVAEDTPRARCCIGQNAHATSLCGAQAFTEWPAGYSWETWPKCPYCQRRNDG